MEIRAFSSPDAAAAAAADLVADLLSAEPDSVLALPTGHTPVPLYRALVRRHREGRADFSRASAFSMDELIGIAPDHPASYQAFLREHLFRHVNIAAARTHLLTGNARNWRAEAARIERTSEVKPAADSLTSKLTGVEGGLIQFRSQSGQDPIRFAGKLDNQLAELYGYVTGPSGYIAGGVEGRPTRGATERLADLQREWAPLRAQLQVIIDRDLAAFNALLQRLGLGAIVVPRRVVM